MRDVNAKLTIVIITALGGRMTTRGRVARLATPRNLIARLVALRTSATVGCFRASLLD
jgi:hypothetical protein